MKRNISTLGSPTRREIVEARLGSQLASCLSEHTASLPHDICERLRVARESAVAQAVATAQVRAAPAGQPNGSATLSLLGGAWWWRAANVLPAVVLALGMLLVDDLIDQQQVQAAADIDATLLAEDLPPQAFVDPGFREFLKSPQP